MYPTVNATAIDPKLPYLKAQTKPFTGKSLIGWARAVNKNKWSTLPHEYRYTFGDGSYILLHPNTYTDGASVPWWFLPVISIGISSPVIIALGLLFGASTISYSILGALLVGGVLRGLIGRYGVLAFSATFHDVLRHAIKTNNHIGYVCVDNGGKEYNVTRKIADALFNRINLECAEYEAAKNGTKVHYWFYKLAYWAVKK